MRIAILRKELLRRCKIDYEMFQKGEHEARAKIIRENADWLSSVISQQGWPDASIVKADGEHAAWYIAQNAKHNPVFQNQVLRLIHKQDKTDARLKYIAHLSDAVLVAQGKPQWYGTVMKDGQMYPVKEPEKLDERRRQMKLD